MGLVFLSYFLRIYTILSVPVTFGPLVSIISALAPSPHFEIFSLLRLFLQDIYPGYNCLLIQGETGCIIQNLQLVCKYPLMYQFLLLCIIVIQKISFLQLRKLITFGMCIFVPPATTSIPTNYHLSLNHFHLSRFSVVCYHFRTYRTVPKYAKICFAVHPYSNTSSTIIFDTTFFIL